MINAAGEAAREAGETIRTKWLEAASKMRDRTDSSLNPARRVETVEEEEYASANSSQEEDETRKEEKRQ